MMRLVFRKPTTLDKIKINRFLILLRDSYTPSFSDEERKAELDGIYSGKTKAILALTPAGQLIGYLAWQQHSKNEEYGYIANLGVHPGYRGRGISIKLREIAFNKIKKAGFWGVYYTTWHKNKAMMESSKKLGMRIVKVYPDEKFRGPGGKTVVFRKDF